MSLFLGSGPSSTPSTRYSDRYSPPTDYSRRRYSSRYSPPTDYSGSRYPRDAVSSPLGDYSGTRSVRSTQPSQGREYTGSCYSRDDISSPPPCRQTQSYTASSRYLSQYSLRSTESSVHDRSDPSPGFYQRTENESKPSNPSVRIQESKSRSSVIVLNEGTIVIRREGGEADTSEEEDEEDCPEDEKKPPTPERNPLEVRNRKQILRVGTHFQGNLHSNYFTIASGTYHIFIRVLMRQITY